VIATQAFINPIYGEKGIALLERGLCPTKIFQELCQEDADYESRQIIMLSANHQKHVAHTGKDCISFANHACGEKAICAGNVLENRNIPEAMLHGYEQCRGDFAEKLIMALQCAENCGGDLRGKKSSALMVFSPDKKEYWADGVLINLRVEANDEPVKELQRLLKLRKAYDCLNISNEYYEKQQYDLAKLMFEQMLILEPNEPELIFWAKIASKEQKYNLPDNWQELFKRMGGK